MYKILLADDHSVIRTGLKISINEFGVHAEIHEAANADEIVAKLKTEKPDLIIMDIQMPETDALGLVQFIKARYNHINVLIFSINPEEIYASRFLKEGAKGFISKNATLDELKKAILLTLSGKTYISDQLMERLAYGSFSDKSLNPFNTLSTREFEVATRILSGDCLTDIAKSLSLCQSTIGTHKARVFEKLHVSNVLQLKDLATVYGIV